FRTVQGWFVEHDEGDRFRACADQAFQIDVLRPMTTEGLHAPGGGIDVDPAPAPEMEDTSVRAKKRMMCPY
ncbi:hypothetical protein COF09_32640, partial [Bacillus toyonensis]